MSESTDSELQVALNTVVANVCDNMEDLKKAVFSTRGKRKGLVKTGKPKDGIQAYIWRMCRFYSGDDMTMPMTAQFDLMDGIKKETGKTSKEIGWTSPEFNVTCRKLDELALILLRANNIPMRGVEGWRRALLGE